MGHTAWLDFKPICDFLCAGLKERRWVFFVFFNTVDAGEILWVITELSHALNSLYFLFGYWESNQFCPENVMDYGLSKTQFCPQIQLGFGRYPWSRPIVQLYFECPTRINIRKYLVGSLFERVGSISIYKSYLVYHNFKVYCELLSKVFFLILDARYCFYNICFNLSMNFIVTDQL